MTQVRRVTRRFGAPRTLRPSEGVSSASPALRSVVFRLGALQASAQTHNLFLDLDEPLPAAPKDTRARLARARLARSLDATERQVVTNIFADCPEDDATGPDALELRLTALRAAHPRKMEIIRAQMAEAHVARQIKARQARYPTAKEAIGLAAGVIIAMMFMPMPPLF